MGSNLLSWVLLLFMLWVSGQLDAFEGGGGENLIHRERIGKYYMQLTPLGCHASCR